VLESSRARINAELPADALVLDVGGWGSPLSRADGVRDLMPYETRGLYGESDPDPERFTPGTWVVRDICDREPWPFADNQFDFAVCAHTLEDIRDPLWVCAELIRVARAGYVEVPARSQEQTPGVQGPWVGWSHHHWLIDIVDDGIEFVFKTHLLHGRPEFCVDPEWTRSRSAEDLVSTLFWRDSFGYAERIFYEPDDLHRYLASVTERYGAPIARRPAESGLSRGLRRMIRAPRRAG
jgi:hypothetical protein